MAKVRPPFYHLHRAWSFYFLRAYAKTRAGVLGNAPITRVNTGSPQWAADEAWEARGYLYPLIYCTVEALSWWGERGEACCSC